ncbi:Protein LOL1 [Glycine soja]
MVLKLSNFSSGVQSQLVCSGCRNLLVFPVGATSVCCAVCNAVTAVPPPDKSETLVCDRHRNGPVSMWRLPYFTHVHPGRDKCAMFLLSHCQSSFGRPQQAPLSRSSALKTYKIARSL